jgi:hypothetical protein
MRQYGGSFLHADSQFGYARMTGIVGGMPAPRERSPDYWRDLAVQTRDAAERMKDHLSKQMMLMIADDYDRLAAAIEQEIRASKKPK